MYAILKANLEKIQEIMTMGYKSTTVEGWFEELGLAARAEARGMEKGWGRGLARGMDALMELIEQGISPREAREMLGRQNPPMAAG
jgi:hypothetical protein